MNRIMKGSLIVLSLLIYMLISLQGTLWAKATKSPLTGWTDDLGGFSIDHPDFRTWVDGAGWTHYENLIVSGNFEYSWDGNTIEGKRKAVFSGFLDDNGNGRWWGHETSTIIDHEGQEIVVFEGHWSKPKWENDMTLYGTMQLQGRGPYEGLILQGTFHDISPEKFVFDDGSFVLDPHGE